MKKTVLKVIILVMLATPCLAEEAVPEWMDAMHGTRWISTCHTKPYDCTFAFYDGNVYGLESWGLCWIMGVKYYGELPFVTLYPRHNESSLKNIAMFQPMIGLGIEFWVLDWPPFISIALFYKVSDDWEPAGCEDPGNVG